jgi:hypothetical protein
MRSIAAIVAGIICATGFSAGAGPLPPGKHSDAVISHPYQQTITTTCNTSGTCTLIWPATTKAETLIQHVACGFAMGDTGKTNAAALSVKNSTLAQPVSVFAFAAVAGVAYRGVNADVEMFFAMGQQPRFDLITSAPPGTVTCTLSGYFG